MKSLITGVDGFVGSYLAKFLLRAGDEVFGTVLHQDHVENIPDIKDKIAIKICDIRDKQQIKEVLATVRPDKIFHLAAQSNIPFSWKNMSETFAVNVMGSIYLLEALAEIQLNKVKVLMVCSGLEYGNSADSNAVITETTSLSPHNPYAVSKTAVDWISQQCYINSGLHIIRSRSFNHSGPGQNSSFVISDFSKQIAEIEKGLKGPVIEVGNIDTYRDFTDVRDVVAAYELLLAHGEPGEVYNVASGNLYNIKVILDKLLALSEREIEVKVDPNKFRPNKFRPTEVKTSSIDIGKIKKITGWMPKITIEQTLADTLNWWRGKIFN